MEATLEQTKKEIAEAAASAVRVIAQAAQEAAKVVSDAAAVSVKVLDNKNASDHDLLIELKTKMIDLKSDIKDLKDGTSLQISKHETRITNLENFRTRQTVLISIGIGILTLLVSLMAYHILGMSI